MILLHSNIFKFYEKDKNVADYTYGKYHQAGEIEKEANVKKKGIALLEDLPQLTEEKKTKKETVEQKKEQTPPPPQQQPKAQEDFVFEDKAVKKEREKALQEIDEIKKKAQEIEKKANQQARQTLEAAKQQAENILFEARQQAEQMKSDAQKQGYEEGYEEGTIQGQQKAEQECKMQYDQMSQKALEDIKLVIESAEAMKEEMLQKYRDQLRDVAVAIAEKVIQVSLKSSGEVIERMIIAATEKLKSREWAKVYIARCDAEMMVEGDSALLRHLAHLSDHVKIVVMEHETAGTCIIELPDEIIDASASTQMVNIKEILNSASL